tara:strand:- start:624 stop:818 length:195 start_codon:yes stop_codon:yes gene_type:complete
MSYLENIKKELHQAQQVLNDFVANEDNLMLIEDAADLIVGSFNKGGKVISYVSFDSFDRQPFKF